MNVLLLTEDPTDNTLFEESMASLSPAHTFTGCDSALAFWEKFTSGQIPRPSLIFLDFELSRSYDHELIPILKRNAGFDTASMIVYGNSVDMQDELADTDASRITCFILFPREPELRRLTIQMCVEYWGTYVELHELRKQWSNGRKC